MGDSNGLLLQQGDLHNAHTMPALRQTHRALEHFDFWLQVQQPTKRSSCLDLFDLEVSSFGYSEVRYFDGVWRLDKIGGGDIIA